MKVDLNYFEEVYSIRFIYYEYNESGKIKKTNVLLHIDVPEGCFATLDDDTHNVIIVSTDSFFMRNLKEAAHLSNYDFGPVCFDKWLSPTFKCIGTNGRSTVFDKILYLSVNYKNADNYKKFFEAVK